MKQRSYIHHAVTHACGEPLSGGGTRATGTSHPPDPGGTRLPPPPSGAAAALPALAAQAGAALIAVVLLPALALIAVAVRLSSPGPVLVRQTRRYDGDRPFPRLRFRTTTTEACQPSTGADVRLTAIGSVLRRLSLDDLPSLLDVARGRTPFRG